MILFFYAVLITAYSTIDNEPFCRCQSDQILHFKEKKDETNPCNVIELHLNGELIKDFNPKISQQLLQTAPRLKFPGRKLVKHDMMTLALFKPITINSLKAESKKNIFIHWLISQVPSFTSRFNINHTFNLLPGYQYIEYLAPEYNNDNDKDNTYILAFYHQHESKDYFGAHRYRKFDHFFNSIGDMIICQVIQITS